MANKAPLPPLHIAARFGDVDFLREALSTQPVDYFFAREVLEDGVERYNFIHYSIVYEQEEFLKEALENLERQAVQLLLCQELPSLENNNAFHFAAFFRGNVNIVKLLIGFYAYPPSSSLSPTISSPENPPSKPWLALDDRGRTPLHMALQWGHEECALELMSMDSELLCNMVDNEGISPLLQAVRRGCGQVAQKILTAGHSYSTSGENGLTPLDVVPNCTEEVCTLLLEKHPEMIRKVGEGGITLLHKWVMIGKLWPFKLLINRDVTSARRKDFIDLLCSTETLNDQNPLHCAAYSSSEETVEVAQFLVEAYIDAYEQEKGEITRLSPWKRENVAGDTPLILALIGRNEQLAMYFLSVDLQNLVIYDQKSVLYCAVMQGCNQAAEMILTSVDPACFKYIKYITNSGQNVLHVASNCTERTGNLLVEKLPWLINEPDDNGKRPLDLAAEDGTAWLIRLLLTKDPSSIMSAPRAWIEACKRGHLSAIDAFINHSPDFKKLCLEQKDTPLHHIKLKTYRDYKDFLAIPLMGEMKNTLDSDSATPLHRAIGCKDMLVAEVLLTMDGVNRNIKDKNGKTATDLLADVCDHHQEWDEMCKRIRINPRLRITYIQPATTMSTEGTRQTGTLSAGEMRSTLSVVAALLATLTFAAGFTLPGGFNSDTGEAILAKKASFLVFLLADTYAMCCSMLVLFCLIWSMVCDHDRSLILIDRSVVILMHSLYGTLVAFMTGIYTVVSHKSLWAAILVFIICSVVAISAKRSILYRVIDKLVPSAGRKSQDQTRLLEQGKVSTPGGDNSQNNIQLSTL